MGVCTGISALQLAAIGASFLLAVLCLDMLWVKLPEELHNGDIAPTLKRQSWLNMFVAFGASAAAVMLMIWSARAGRSQARTGQGEEKLKALEPRRSLGVLAVTARSQ